MTQTQQWPQFKLYFSGGNHRELVRSEFQVKPAATIVKTTRESGHMNSISWSRGVQSLAIFLVEYVGWSKKQKPETFEMRGERKSPTASLDMALGKGNSPEGGVRWQGTMFGQPGNATHSYLNTYIKRTNPDQKRKAEPFGLRVLVTQFPPNCVRFFLDEKELKEANELEELSSTLCKAWTGVQNLPSQPAGEYKEEQDQVGQSCMQSNDSHSNSLTEVGSTKESRVCDKSLSQESEKAAIDEAVAKWWRNYEGVDRLGVIVLRGERSQVGHYGYVAPFRHSPPPFGIYERNPIQFFDVYSLLDRNEPIVEGDIVRYQIELSETYRSRAVNVELNKFTPHNPQLDFEIGDLRNPNLLNLDDVILRHLLTNSPGSKGLSDWWKQEETGQPDNVIALKLLNKILQGPLIYDAKRFENVKLRPQTQVLLKKASQAGRSRWLNRLLLEDAFPEMFSVPPQNLSVPPPVHHASIIERNARQRSGLLGLLNGKSILFSFDDFPSDELVPHTGVRVQCRIYFDQYASDGQTAPYDIWELSPQS